MDLKQLQYFVTIAEEGSISAAAQKLFMSQPPLSYQMKLLEKELNCILFERGSRHIQLTDEGKLLYHKALSLLELSKVTKDEILSFSEKNHGIVRVGIVSSVVSSYGTQWISAFSKKNPSITFEIFEANTYELLEKLKSGTIHFAILRTPYANENFASVSLASEKLIAVGASHFFVQKETITLSDLSNLPLILYRRWERIIRNHFETNKRSYNIICMNDDARTTAAFVEEGIGVGLIPESALQFIHNLDVVSREITDCTISSDIEFVYNPNSYIPSCGRAFQEFMQGL